MKVYADHNYQAGAKPTGLPTPTGATDAAPKGYVDGLKVASTLVADGVEDTFEVEHNLGTYDVTVEVYASAAPRASMWGYTVERTNTDTVTIVFDSPPAVDHRVVIRG